MCDEHKMKTQKELIREHRQGLDKRFVEKYPNGLFTVQLRYGKYGYDKKTGSIATIYGIHYNVKRRTSWCSYRGISVEFDKRKDTIHVETSQNNSFGYCYHADSFDKCIALATKHNLPAIIVNEFQKAFRSSKYFVEGV